MVLIAKKNTFEAVSKDLDVRPYQKADYRIAQKWWLQTNSTHLEHHFLPNTGAVVIQKGNPVAMGWVYLSNSPIAQLSWVVSKPSLGPKAKFLAVGLVIDMCEQIARNNGYKMIQMFSDRSGLSKIAQMSKFNMIRQHDFLVKYIKEDDEDV